MFSKLSEISWPAALVISVVIVCGTFIIWMFPTAMALVVVVLAIILLWKFFPDEMWFVVTIGLMLLVMAGESLTEWR